MLFDKLTSETRKKVFLSMNPLEVLPKTVIIQQGDTEASMFYVLEAGACDVLISTDGASKVVHQYKAGRCVCILAFWRLNDVHWGHVGLTFLWNPIII